MSRSGCIALVAMGLLLPGCARQPASSTPTEDEPEYGHLPGLRQSGDPQLREELARLEQEGATPRLLTVRDLADEENVAAGLENLFSVEARASLRAETNAIMPRGAFEIRPPTLVAMRRFFTKHQRAWEKSRQVLRRPECNLRIRHDLGLDADLSLINSFWVCARLEAFHVAIALDALDTRAALESLSHILRYADCLAGERCVATRLEAAYLRTEALSIAQEIVNNAGFTAFDLETLHQLLSRVLEDWTPDREAWIGDRALGICTYEAARAGQIAMILTPKERQTFEAEGILDRIKGVSGEALDRDQRAYLAAMRTIIDACDLPYHARLPVLKKIRDDLARQWGTAGYPILAGRVLLSHVATGHEVQAWDRANVQAWLLATALACGRDAPGDRTNPLTGCKFQVSYEDDPLTTWPGMIVVAAPSPDRDDEVAPIIVPDFHQGDTPANTKGRPRNNFPRHLSGGPSPTYSRVVPNWPGSR